MSGINWDVARVAWGNLRRLAIDHPELTCRSSEAIRPGWENDLEEVMSRTRSLGKTTQRAIRLPVALLKRIERHAEKMRKRNPGLSISVADAIRTLLTAALDQEEAEAE